MIKPLTPAFGGPTSFIGVDANPARGGRVGYEPKRIIQAREAGVFGCGYAG
jgi:hypothetical protein